MEQNDNQLEYEVRRADVICVVYSVDDEDTLDSVTEHWLPFIRYLYENASNFKEFSIFVCFAQGGPFHPILTT